MEENHHDDQNMVAIAATSSTPSTKDGVQLLHELLAVAYHVFEEAKHINLKPPLQPSSRLFSQDGSATNTLNNSSPFGSPVPQGSPLEDLSTDLNGVGGSGSEITTPIANATTTPNPFNTTGISSSTHALHQVIPFTHDEIQDTYTKIVTLKNLYIKLSTELSESIKKSETSQESVAEDDQDVVEKLLERRDHLRKEVYERNLVMKGLIDRLRHLQHTLRFLHGGSDYTSNIIMETV